MLAKLIKVCGRPFLGLLNFFGKFRKRGLTNGWVSAKIPQDFSGESS